jgi:hypothetical protein
VTLQNSHCSPVFSGDKDSSKPRSKPAAEAATIRNNTAVQRSIALFARNHPSVINRRNQRHPAQDVSNNRRRDVRAKHRVLNNFSARRRASFGLIVLLFAPVLLLAFVHKICSSIANSMRKRFAPLRACTLSGQSTALPLFAMRTLPRITISLAAD